MKKLKKSRFQVLLIIVGTLTFASLYFAVKKDEGTLANNIVFNFLADSFKIFRFPTNILLPEDTDESVSITGLIINVILYASVLNMLLAPFINDKKKGAAKTAP